MQKYVVVNRHTAEECEPMEAGLENLPGQLVGQEFICTCPEGPHGFYMVLEGDTAEEIIQGLPAEWRRGTDAYPAEIFNLARRQPAQ